MLLHLTIRNVVIIEEVSIDFSDGMTAFTGETGAGKSILIDSLLLALGGRATSDVVRTGAESAEVIALFDLGPKDAVRQRLEGAGIHVESDLSLRRVVSSNGRSRAFVNERPVTASFLREIGGRLVEISGQHEQQRLMHPKQHLDLLDHFGKLFPVRQEVATLHQELSNIRRELRKRGGSEADRERRRDYLNYQIDELDKIELDINETELEDKRRFLQQLEKIVEACRDGEMSLYSGPHAVSDQVARLSGRLEGWADQDESLAEAAQHLEEAGALLDEAARTLRSFLARTDTDPAQLQALEAQLSQLRDLKRKHGVTSVEELRESRQRYEDELQQLDQEEDLLIELEAQYKQALLALKEKSALLSKKRKDVAGDLSKAVEGELATLGMKRASFSVEFLTQLDSGEDEIVAEPMWDDEEPELDNEAAETQIHEYVPSRSGQDQVQFLLSGNPGEEPRPLHKIASGGELSRIMLGLKQILTEDQPVETCVFDEVDTGIGGFTATIIGEKIKRIASKRQVFCITHLPQIACFANHHFLIQKNEQNGRTRSSISKVDESSREDELARMLGGKEVTEQSRAHARELLEVSAKFEKVELAQTRQNKSKRRAKPKSKSKGPQASAKNKKAMPKATSEKKRSTKKTAAKQSSVKKKVEGSARSKKTPTKKVAAKKKTSAKKASTKKSKEKKGAGKRSPSRTAPAA